MSERPQRFKHTPQAMPTVVVVTPQGIQHVVNELEFEQYLRHIVTNRVSGYTWYPSCSPGESHEIAINGLMDMAPPEFALSGRKMRSHWASSLTPSEFAAAHVV